VLVAVALTKHMKLSQLLHRITGLPWAATVHADLQTGHITGQQRRVANVQPCAAVSVPEARANLVYLTHAANVLPDAVAALEMLLADQRRPKSELSRGQFEFCESTLARAKTLEPKRKQLWD
jgi:hypothetical protein